MTIVKWFESESAAKKCQKEHNGELYKNTQRSKTKDVHIGYSKQFNFDPERFKYSVTWKYPKGENEI